jgi:hypothetical protein
VLTGAKGEDPLLGAAFFFIAPRTTKSNIEVV